MSAIAFLLGFAIGTLLICILFMFVVSHAARGNAEARKEQKELNLKLMKYWTEANYHQSLQTDALTAIAEEMKKP